MSPETAVFYKQTQPEQLTRAQMEMARKAFRGKLVRLRYSPQFIVNNTDELLAIAHTEFARAVERGIEIEDPVAWTIHCAWRRTQNLLESESHGPRVVSSEKVLELADEETPLPEDLALEEDRAQKIREAVAKLDEDQRKVIALTFFEDMSVREAARHLGCSASSVQHRRETALRTLRRFLPVRSGDDLAVDFGMACWLALAAGHTGVHLPAGFEAVLDRAGHGASGVWGRAQDLARRLGFGGGADAATAVASSGAGRAAGVCATGLAVVCLAGAGTGVVGPGIGAFTDGGGHQQAPPPKVRPKRRPPPPDNHVGAHQAVTPSTTNATAGAAESSPSAPRTEAAKLAGARKATTGEAADESVPTATKAKHEAAKQVEEETSGIARAGAEAPASSPPVAAASDEGSEAATVVHTSSASSHSSGTAASEEFNFEK